MPSRPPRPANTGDRGCLSPFNAAALGPSWAIDSSQELTDPDRTAPEIADAEAEISLFCLDEESQLGGFAGLDSVERDADTRRKGPDDCVTDGDALCDRLLSMVRRSGGLAATCDGSQQRLADRAETRMISMRLLAGTAAL